MRPETVDLDRLRDESQYRFEHLCELLGFDDEDWRRVQQSAGWLEPEWKPLVRDVYETLLQYEPTARFYRDETDELDSESLQHRVNGFVHWFRRITTAESVDDLGDFFADVGRIHTADKGFSELVVDEFYLSPTLTLLMNGIRCRLADRVDSAGELNRTAEAWQKFMELQRSLFRQAYRSTESS